MTELSVTSLPVRFTSDRNLVRLKYKETVVESEEEFVG